MSTLFDVAMTFDTTAEALEWAHGFVFGECPSSEQDRPKRSVHIESFDGVGVWYDYAADYYFFEDETPES